MAALSWDEICNRALQYKKVALEEAERTSAFESKRRIKCKCLRCNNIYVQFFSKLFSWSCQTCSMASMKELNFSKLQEKLYILSEKKQFEVLEYVGVIYKRKVHHWKTRCQICGFESVKALFSLRRHGCQGCQIERFKSNISEFIEKARLVHGYKFDYSLSVYTKASDKIAIKCLKCGVIFNQKANNHLSGMGCPKCNESKGENRVAKYLSENNIRFTKDKIFKTLKDKSYLKPDFYLDDLNLLIEYDGEFHYKALIGSTQEIKQKNLETQQRRDKIKNEWAKDNNIPLLRIPYWDYDNIEELIEKFILDI
jgi:predicted  nucleic acid-binding Zn-ribbon protein